jgi:hypothetical protein
MANPYQNARGAHGRYVATPEAAERAAQAADLRAQGWTYQRIADELGYANKSVARGAVRNALSAIGKERAEKLFELERERLETVYEEVLDILERDHVMVSHGKVIKDDAGNPLLDDGIKLQAVDRLLRTRESFRKLVGLDQPTKTEVSGGVKYEVVGVDPADLT